MSTTKVGVMQALLDTERQSSTSSPSMERELVCLRHSYSRLIELLKIWTLMLLFMVCLHAFVLHPFSHYNSITEPHARFLLSLL